MPLSVLFFVAALLVAATVLAIEAWSGQIKARPVPHGLPMIALFALASVGGTTLLLALSGGEWLMATALAPLTALCVLRLWFSLKPVKTQWIRAIVLVAVLVSGVAVGLVVTPVPLTRDIMRGVEAPPGSESNLPGGGRTVRG